MKLVIIEGPGKQATIKKYLGDDYTVFATKGHIRDLPARGMNVDINNDFKPNYQPMQDKKKIIDELQKIASKSDEIYLATDPDREGEAISWHLSYLLNLNPNDKHRIAFNEISQKAVTNALQNPRGLDLNLVDAYQARRILDRLVGYKLSPILNKKFSANLSAGRVQSAALKLIVDREREIRNFVPTEYWTVNGLFSKDNIDFKTLLVAYNGKKFTINNKEEMDKVLLDLKQSQFNIGEVKKEVKYTHPNAPFITSSMQQDAGQKLKMPLSIITRTAQELYEGVNIAGHGKKALITYIRTDSTRVSADAQAMAKTFIVEKYGEKFIPKKYNIYASKASAQEGHEAIRPIDVTFSPDVVKKDLTDNQYKLYKLIYERFLASQMADYVYDSVVVDVDGSGYTFRVSGKTPIFEGFKILYKNEEEVDETESSTKLPQLNQGDNVKVVDFMYEQKFTKPPTRFTEPTFIKLMENKGIGRPATYANTVDVLFKRNYCEKEAKYFVPTEVGCNASDFLSENFADIVNVKFTAKMEDELDEVSSGKMKWVDVVKEFYKDFEPQLKKVDKNSIKPEPVVTEFVCDKCGAFMVKRVGPKGEFLACPNFPKCKNIKDINGKEFVQEPLKVSEEKCEKCGALLVYRKGKNGTFLACPNFPKCKFTKNVSTPKQNEEGGVQKEEDTSYTPVIDDVKCEKCGAIMIVKNGRNGKFLACPNFPKCRFTKTYEQKSESEK